MIGANLGFITSLLIIAVLTLSHFVWMRCRPSLEDVGALGPQHLVCIMLYKEPDAMILDTIRQLNDSLAAPRMHVLFAMEEGTDRPEERFKTYAAALPNVPHKRSYRHPRGLAGEIQGLCSNVAWAMRQYVCELCADPSNAHNDFSNYLFTKLDAQVGLHPQHFQELDRCFLSWQAQGESRSPVVFQPLPVSCIGREAAYSFSRAMCACRTATYSIFFQLSLMVVTCYSVPLTQYVGMGLHHPGFMAEDMMMLMQNNVVTKRWTKVWRMRVPVATAPTLGSGLCQALVEFHKQNVRWRSQTLEAAEFALKHGRVCSVTTMPFLVLFWWWSIITTDGLSPFAILNNVPPPAGLQHTAEGELLQHTSLVLVCLLGFALLFVVVIEQLISSLLPGLAMPLRQLPFTFLASPLALTAMSFVDIFAIAKFLALGKAGVVLTHRAKLAEPGVPCKTEDAEGPEAFHNHEGELLEV